MKISKQRHVPLANAALQRGAFVVAECDSTGAVASAGTGAHRSRYDFARVLDEQTRQQLENILTNVKLKTWY